MLDYYYGDIYSINHALCNNIPIEYDALKNLYREILFDVYYCAISTTIIIILAIRYIKRYKD